MGMRGPDDGAVDGQHVHREIREADAMDRSGRDDDLAHRDPVWLHPSSEEQNAFPWVDHQSIGEQTIYNRALKKQLVTDHVMAQDT
jgi:hypothetical protein